MCLLSIALIKIIKLWYINGEHDTFVELILDSHFDKFEKGAIYYNNGAKNVVYLDLKAHGDNVATFPEGKDNVFYSFVMNQNALYKGNSLVKAGVSKNLPLYPVNGQRKMFTTLIYAAKRFVK